MGKVYFVFNGLGLNRIKECNVSYIPRIGESVACVFGSYVVVRIHHLFNDDVQSVYVMCDKISLGVDVDEGVQRYNDSDSD